MRKQHFKTIGEIQKEIETIRKRYDPRNQGIRIKILFVAESPPPQKFYQQQCTIGFFYNRNTILYFATFCAFNRKFGIPEQDFLDFFKKLGCYLHDLLNIPNQKINQVSHATLQNAKLNLNNFIIANQPDVVIVVHKGVYKEIEVRQGLLTNLKNQGVIKKFFSLPFPRDAINFVRYVEGLEKILNDLINQNVITIDAARNKL